MRHLARLAQQARGVTDGLRPALDRWHIERAPAAFVELTPVERDGPPRATSDRLARAIASQPSRSFEQPEPRHRKEANTIGAARSRAESARSSTSIVDRENKSTPLDPGEPAVVHGAMLHAEDPPARRTDRATAVTQSFEQRTQRTRPQARLLPLQDISPPPTARARAAPLESRHRAAIAGQPGPVYVHIGRIDVRAIDAAPAKPPARSRPALHAPSLEAHLHARDGGVR